MKKSSYLLLLLIVIGSSCKFPELLVKLKAMECGLINARLNIRTDNTKYNEYHFYLDSLKGKIKKIKWMVNEQPIDELSQNQSVSYTFTSDGNYIISVEVIDSCYKSFKLSKALSVKDRQCTPINASLIIRRDNTKLNEYYFNLDSLKGNIKQIKWKVNDQLMHELPQNPSFNYTFNTDGNYTISTEVLDSCNNSFKLSKSLSVKTGIYVLPITKFMNNDGTEGDIKGMTFGSDGTFRSYMLWNNVSNFYPDKSYKFADCGPINDGDNGNIGDVIAFRYRQATKQYYIFELRWQECTSDGSGWGDILYRSAPTLKTYPKLAGKYSFELGRNNIFMRGNANIVLVPYNSTEETPELVFVKDSIKYNFNAYGYMFGKYNENEYLAVSMKPSQYTFVKFFEDSRQAQELFNFKLIENSADGIYSDNKVGIGKLIDVCIDANGEIWIIENIERRLQLYIPAYRIRKIAKNGIITTIIDNSTPQIADLNYGQTVNLKNLKCIAYNPKDNAVYFSDGGAYKKIVIK